MITFFWIWLASMIVQLIFGFIGRFLPKPKYAGGYDPMYVMLWFPVLNTVIAVFCVCMLVFLIFKKNA